MTIARIVSSVATAALVSGSSCSRDSAAPRIDTVASGACAAQDASLTLPAGFCAGIFADAIGAARHVVVASNGDVFVTLQGGSATVVALRDVNHDGHADSVGKNRIRRGRHGDRALRWISLRG